MPKIWFISDTHNQHDRLVVPPGIDAVVHCGDESTQRKSKWNEAEARAFFEWYARLPVATRVYVPGNHSTAVEQGLIRPGEYPGIQFLIHQAWHWSGLALFGSPYTPWFFGWAYNVHRPKLEPLWQAIPSETEILITHGPPKGIRDVTRDWRSREPIHVGSQSLTRQVTQRIQPRIHAFGHLHDEQGIANFGQHTEDGIQFVNCACCDLSGRLIHHGMVLEV